MLGIWKCIYSKKGKGPNEKAVSGLEPNQEFQHNHGHCCDGCKINFPTKRKYPKYNSKSALRCRVKNKEKMESIKSEKFPSDKYRTELPAPAFSRAEFSVWSILRQCIGKDLSRITMPVVFNEPLSFLQRTVEYLEYAHLIQLASRCSDPVDRLQYITALAVSATSSNYGRLGKPFNPLLGETYELDLPEKGFRVCCEQVSHHPPVSAFHAESPLFKFHGYVHPKLKFWGRSVEVQPKGVVTLELLKHHEIYTWHNVDCVVNNIIIGTLTVQHCGELEVVNQRTKDRAVVKFKPVGKDPNRCDGFIFDSSGKKVRALYGRWTHFLKACDVPAYEAYMRDHGKGLLPTQASHMHVMRSSHTGPLSGSDTTMQLEDSGRGRRPVDGDAVDSETGGRTPPTPDPFTQAQARGFIDQLHVSGSTLLWEAQPRPPNSEQMYNFTSLSMMLNETPPEVVVAGSESVLCPTDCRRRPDIRLMELGDIDGAAEEKLRLEEKQRESRKERKKRTGQDAWTPLWFKPGQNTYTDEEDWLFTNKYWRKDWSDVPDIF